MDDKSEAQHYPDGIEIVGDDGTSIYPKCYCGKKFVKADKDGYWCEDECGRDVKNPILDALVRTFADGN